MKRRKIFSHNFILAWITVLLVGFGSHVIAQTEFIKEYSVIPNSFTLDSDQSQTRIAQSSEGFVVVARDGVGSKPELLTLDLEGELTGICKEYDLLNTKSLSVTPIESGAGVSGYLIYGEFSVDGGGGVDWNYLIKTDVSGNVDWSRKIEFEEAIGTFDSGANTHAMQVADGNIIFSCEFNPSIETGERHLAVLKVNPTTGALIWNQKLNVASSNGFFLNGILEGQPGHYYFFGGHTGTSLGNFIVHMFDTGTGTTSGVKFFNIWDATTISTVAYDGDDLIVGGNIGGASRKVFVFRIDDNLNNIESLGGVPDKCDVYNIAEYESLLGLIPYNERIVITGTHISDGTIDRRFTSVLSSTGSVLNRSVGLIGGLSNNRKNIFPKDDAFIVGHFRGHKLRLESFSPLGNTCEQENPNINRSDQNVTTTSPILISTSHNLHYDALTVVAEDAFVNRNEICSDCIPLEDVDPITTSTGSFELCELESLDLIAPDGFLWHRWFLDGELVFFSTDDTYTIYEGGEYSLILTDSLGCEVELFITIDPRVDVSEIDGSTMCLGASFVLPSFDDGGSWSGPYIIGGPDTYFFSPTSVGTYTITYCNPFGCCVDAEITIKEATIELLDVGSICDGELSGSITVTTGGGSVNWLLTDDLGATTYMLGETVTFSDLGPGIYTIQATLPAPPNCSSTITVEIKEDGWHKTTSNTTGEESSNDVVTDSEGNVYVVGTYSNTTEIEGGANPNIVIGPAASASGCMYVAKYDNCGTLIWVAHSSGAQLCSGKSLVVDENNGMVYVTGNLFLTAQFQSAQSAFDLCGVSNTQLVTASADGSGYVAQYDMYTGCLYFAEKFDVGYFQDNRSITIHEDTNWIYIGGSFKPSLTSTGDYSFIQKFAPTVDYDISNALNDPVWTVSEELNSPFNSNVVNDLDFDEANDRLYSIGTFKTEMQFLGTSISSISPVSDAFISTFVDGGETVTLADLRKGSFGSSLGKMTGEGISVEKGSETIFFTGSYSGTNLTPFSFIGIDPIYSPGSLNEQSYMIGASITDTITPWARHTIPSPASGWVTGKDVTNQNGNVYFLNEFSGIQLTVAPGGTDLSDSKLFVGDPTGNTHVGAISYTNTGSRNWMNVTNSIYALNSDDHNAFSITSDDFGNCFIAGDYNHTLSYFDGTPFSGDLYRTGSGIGNNAFVMRVQSLDGAFKSASTDTEANLQWGDGLIQLYPNPTNGIVTIDSKDLRDHQFTITNMLGKVVYNGTLNSGTVQLNLSHLKKGVYIININSSGSKDSQKLIIQ